MKVLCDQGCVGAAGGAFWLLSSVLLGIVSADCTATGGVTMGVVGRKSGPFWPQAASRQTRESSNRRNMTDPEKKSEPIIRCPALPGDRHLQTQTTGKGAAAARRRYD